MALTSHARDVLRYGLKHNGAADEFADVVDAGSGSLSTFVRSRFIALCGRAEGDGICDAANAGNTALTAMEQDALAVMLGSRVVANEIATEVGP